MSSYLQTNTAVFYPVAWHGVPWKNPNQAIASSDLQGVTKTRSSPSAKQDSRNGKAAFMLLKEEIREQVMACYTMRAIYDHQEQALGISYRQFARYVAEYFQEVRHEVARQPATLVPRRFSAPPAKAQPAGATEEPRRAPAEPRKGFFVDPMAMRRKNLV